MPFTLIYTSWYIRAMMKKFGVDIAMKKKEIKELTNSLEKLGTVLYRAQLEKKIFKENDWNRI